MAELTKKNIDCGSDPRNKKITQEMRSRFWDFKLNPITGWPSLNDNPRAAKNDEIKYAKVPQQMPCFKSMIV